MREREEGVYIHIPFILLGTESLINLSCDDVKARLGYGLRERDKFSFIFLSFHFIGNGELH